jgi:hypothetical protein
MRQMKLFIFSQVLESYINASYIYFALILDWMSKVVSSNTVRAEVYSIQHYVIKFATGRWFSPSIRVSSTNKTDRHNIAEILFKVAVNVMKWGRWSCLFSLKFLRVILMEYNLLRRIFFAYFNFKSSVSTLR